MDQKEREAFRKRVLEGKSSFKPAGHFQTMRLSFEEICRGERPWTALGYFMHDWYGKEPGRRLQLVVEPLGEVYAPEFTRWAAFCAASVRWFCSTYEIPCPSWVDNPRYVLAEPWYMDTPPALWQHERETTAEEFSRHNIYCGNRLYTNKYERDERGIPLKDHPVDLQERRAVVLMAAARLERERAESERRKQGYLPLRLSRLSAVEDQPQATR